MSNVRFTLPDELHKDLKRKAIDESVPLKDLVINALQDYINKHPPMVRKGVTNLLAKGDNK